MVMRFGMSERLGQLTYEQPRTMQFLQAPFAGEERNYSERTARMIDEEGRRFVDEAYERAKMILNRQCEELGRIAGELIRKETLDRAELDKLPAPAPKEAIVPSERGLVSDHSEVKSNILPMNQAVP